MACPSCGSELGTTLLCDYHVQVDTLWSTENRIVNDLLMRGIEPKRLSAQERTDVVISLDPNGWTA